MRAMSIEWHTFDHLLDDATMRFMQTVKSTHNSSGALSGSKVFRFFFAVFFVFVYEKSNSPEWRCFFPLIARHRCHYTASETLSPVRVSSHMSSVDCFRRSFFRSSPANATNWKFSTNFHAICFEFELQMITFLAHSLSRVFAFCYSLLSDNGKRCYRLKFRNVHSLTLLFMCALSHERHMTKSLNNWRIIESLFSSSHWHCSCECIFRWTFRRQMHASSPKIVPGFNSFGIVID